MYYILDGKVSCCIDVPIEIHEKNESPRIDLVRRSLYLYEKNEFFGDHAILSKDSKHTAHCISKTKVKVCYLHRDDLKKIPGLLDHIANESNKKSSKYKNTVALPTVQEDKKKSKGLSLFKKGAKSVIEKQRQQKKRTFGGLEGNVKCGLSITEMVTRMIAIRRER